MLFAEEMNSYYVGPTLGNPSNSGVTPIDMTAPGTTTWKQPIHNEFAGYNETGGSKLISKWGHPMGTGGSFGDFNKNGISHDSGGGPSAFAPVVGIPGGFGTGGWNELPSFQFMNHQQQPQELLHQAENKFANLNMKTSAFHNHAMGTQQPLTGHFTPPIDLVNGQWGRAEVNQTTPWNLDINGDQNSQHQFNGIGGGGAQQHRGNYRKWDQQREEGQLSGPTAYGTSMGPTAGYVPYGGATADRMMPGGGFTHYNGAVGPNNRGGLSHPQRWDTIGVAHGAATKFSEMTSGGRGASGPAGLFTNGPPPPLHSMGVITQLPTRTGGHIMSHMPPPPLLPSLNQPTGMGQFTMNTYMQNGVGMTSSTGLNDDSVWQDPNGELRKWQRDTGTSIWGDPSKQTNMSIQRWQHFTAEEVTAKSNILSKEGGDVESGWGDLPPLGSSASTLANNTVNVGNDGENVVNNSHSSTVNNNGQFSGGGGGIAQHLQQQPIIRNNRAILHNSGANIGRAGGGNSSSSWGQDNSSHPSTQGGWDRFDQQHSQGSNQHSTAISLHQIQHQATGQPTSGGTLASSGGSFILPQSSGSGQQPTIFQPPSLLSSLIDPISVGGGPLAGVNNTNVAGDDQQQQQKGLMPGQQQRKTASPPNTKGTSSMTQQQQTLKVSLAEELSNLGNHGLGGAIW